MAETPGMFFRALGTLEVSREGYPLELGRPRARAVLAMLLISANEIVPVDRITDTLWPDSDPDLARHSLHVAVSDLRRNLEPDLPPSCPDCVLFTSTPGYLLQVGTDAFDVKVAERLAHDGRRAFEGGELERADALLTEALGLWRGTPYADFMYEDFAQAEIRRLDELELSIVEDLIDVELRLGRHHEHIPRLEVLVARHPTREQLLRQLMLALARSKRSVDAVAAFDRARRRLLDEYGTEPHPELVSLANAIRAHNHLG